MDDEIVFGIHFFMGKIECLRFRLLSMVRGEVQLQYFAQQHTTIRNSSKNGIL